MEKIIEAITKEIRDEVLEESIDFPKLQNLIRVALDIKSMAINAVEDASLVDTPPFPYSGMGRPQRVRALPTQNYGPSSMERVIGEYLPGIFATLGSQNALKVASNIASLTDCYATLQKQDPDLAVEIREYITALLKKEKEVGNEDTHTELSG